LQSLVCQQAHFFSGLSLANIWIKAKVVGQDGISYSMYVNSGPKAIVAGTSSGIVEAPANELSPRRLALNRACPIDEAKTSRTLILMARNT
jgi:hypothetical protein